MTDDNLEDVLRLCRRTPGDERRYRRALHRGLAGVLAVYILAGTEWLPPWLLVVVLHGLVARLTIQVHEYIHCAPSEPPDPVIRVLPVMIGPFAGFREVHLLHTVHHAHAIEAEDPDLAITLARPWWTYVGVFFYYEYFALYYLRRIGRLAGGRYAGEVAARSLLFAAAFLWVPWATFLALLVSARLAFATSYFLLSWYLHRDGREVGTYRKTLPRWLTGLVWVLGGRGALATLRYHDLHHRFPAVDVDALGRVAQFVPYDRTAATVYALPLRPVSSAAP